MKIVKICQLKIVIFTAVKNRCMLHGRVFVMYYSSQCRVEVAQNRSPMYRPNMTIAVYWKLSNHKTKLSSCEDGH